MFYSVRLEMKLILSILSYRYIFHIIDILFQSYITKQDNSIFQSALLADQISDNENKMSV